MTIFRYRKNGLLYTLYRVSPPKMIGRWYEAYPYQHDVFIGKKNSKGEKVVFKASMSLNDFENIAYENERKNMIEYPKTLDKHADAVSNLEDKAERARQLLRNLDSLTDQISDLEEVGDQLLLDDTRALWLQTEAELEKVMYG